MGKGWVFVIGLLVGLVAATIVVGISGKQLYMLAKGRFFPDAAA